MRYLGVDPGRARIGLALADEVLRTARAHSMVPRRGDAADLAAIAEVARQYEVTRAVVGLPLNMDGSHGPAAKAAVAEAARLATVAGVPVELHDERRTTVSADRSMLDAGLNAIERRQRVDKVAAAIMLQSWLDARRSRQDAE